MTKRSLVSLGSDNMDQSLGFERNMGICNVHIFTLFRLTHQMQNNAIKIVIITIMYPKIIALRNTFSWIFTIQIIR